MQTLESPRLILRPLQPEDEPFYCGLYADAEVMRHIAAPLSVDEAHRTFHSALRRNGEVGDGDRCWVILRRNDSSRIGVIGWHLLDQAGTEKVADIGAVLARGAQGDGVSVEAGNTLIGHAFEHLQISAFITQHHVAHSYAALMMAKLRFERQQPSCADSSQVIWRMSFKRWTQIHGQAVADST